MVCRLLIALVFSVQTCFAVDLVWQHGENWTEETQLVLIVTDSNGVDYHVAPVRALDSKQTIPDDFFMFNRSYQIKAQAYTESTESDFSNIVAYNHRDGPWALKLPIVVPQAKPDIVILELHFKGE